LEHIDIVDRDIIGGVYGRVGDLDLLGCAVGRWCHGSVSILDKQPREEYQRKSHGERSV